MKMVLFFSIMFSFVFLSCAENEVSVVNTEDKPEVVPQNMHVFSEGEHIFWTSKFENNELVFTLQLAPKWKTYSQYNTNFIGPLPTVFSFDVSDKYELDGKMDEAMAKKKFDKEANQELTYFEGVGIFKQKIKINSGEKFVVKGNVNFMTCNQLGCEPPSDYNFEIEIEP